MAQSAGIPRLSEKLTWLFANVRGPRGSQPSAAELSNDLLDSYGVKVSAQYLNHLRRGYRNAPGGDVVHALAGYFGVPVEYFFDDEVERAVRQDLAALRDVARSDRGDIVAQVARLSPSALEALSHLLDDLPGSGGE
ncbi:helix-turn-helix domain-containing protein [Rudaeicoccus suwonensis]|uniref:HTH cro/C1-type domain-containing protein n=1 Tax=Rudaeicoccus suwonensis TaxID=657409 RepID=A0A561DVI0_9MICO|nr:helix-turn-helix domain-containing protein [Rudaeicoccus suwonensis]TWE07363.1 hypothetical protein BKA23_3376 [Rudaeicoccus suwonensis]